MQMIHLIRSILLLFQWHLFFHQWCLPFDSSSPVHCQSPLQWPLWSKNTKPNSHIKMSLYSISQRIAYTCLVVTFWQFWLTNFCWLSIFVSQSKKPTDARAPRYRQTQLLIGFRMKKNLQLLSYYFTKMMHIRTYLCCSCSLSAGVHWDAYVEQKKWLPFQEKGVGSL